MAAVRPAMPPPAMAISRITGSLDLGKDGEAEAEPLPVGSSRDGAMVDVDGDGEGDGEESRRGGFSY